MLKTLIYSTDLGAYNCQIQGISYVFYAEYVQSATEKRHIGPHMFFPDPV